MSDMLLAWMIDETFGLSLSWTAGFSDLELETELVTDGISQSSITMLAVFEGHNLADGDVSGSWRRPTDDEMERLRIGEPFVDGATSIE